MITKTIHLSVCIANDWGTRIHNKKTYMYSKLSYSINHCTQTCWSVVLWCNNYLYITINYRANFLFRLLTPLPTCPMSIFSNMLIDHSRQVISLTHSDGQGFQKPHGYVGKGQGTDLKTLEKPLPSSRVRGYPWYMLWVFHLIQIYYNYYYYYYYYYILSWFASRCGNHSQKCMSKSLWLSK